MKLEVEDQQLADGAVMEEVVQPVVRGFVKDWDAMEDLLNYVLYRNIGWEIGDEGQILFTEPLFTPKVMDLPAQIHLAQTDALRSRVADGGDLGGQSCPHIVLQQVNVGLNDGLVDWGLFLLALLLIGILDLWFI